MIEAIKYYWNRIALDKKLHFGAGAVISLVVSLVSTAYIGLLVATIAGIVKEAYDLYDYGSFDYRDFIFTLAGGIFGVIIFGVIG